MTGARQTYDPSVGARPRTRRGRHGLGLGLVVVVACTSAEPPSELAPPSRERVAPSPSPLEPAELRPVLVTGDCVRGPGMGELRAYSGASGRLARHPEGIRVRSCAVWPSSDLSNVIGVVESGRVVPLFGPVKHEAFGAGIGYVVPLVDGEGTQCRGYLSATVLEEVTTHPGADHRGALPLPPATAAWTGPCLPGR